MMNDNRTRKVDIPWHIMTVCLGASWWLDCCGADSQATKTAKTTHQRQYK